MQNLAGALGGQYAFDSPWIGVDPAEIDVGMTDSTLREWYRVMRTEKICDMCYFASLNGVPGIVVCYGPFQVIIQWLELEQWIRFSGKCHMCCELGYEICSFNRRYSHAPVSETGGHVIVWARTTGGITKSSQDTYLHANLDLARFELVARMLYILVDYVHSSNAGIGFQTTAFCYYKHEAAHMYRPRCQAYLTMLIKLRRHAAHRNKREDAVS